LTGTCCVQPCSQGCAPCAGDVIAALGSKAEHVPYRNSKVMSALACEGSVL